LGDHHVDAAQRFEVDETLDGVMPHRRQETSRRSVTMSGIAGHCSEREGIGPEIIAIAFLSLSLGG